MTLSTFDRPPALDNGGFDAICAFFQKKIGLSIGGDKRYLVDTRILPIVARESLRGLDELVAIMETGTRPGLVDMVLQAMTVNETYFFRDKIPFDRFSDEMLPSLLISKRPQKLIRIWSAACSTGQEAYSLAMILAEQSHHLDGWRVDLIATDVSDAVLDKARRGAYSTFDIRRGLTDRHMELHFTQHNGEWHIDEKLRRRVTFLKGNLLDNFSSLGPFDVVFCRNVLIYLEANVRTDIVNRLAASLNPGGYLILGLSENLLGLQAGLSPDQRRQYFIGG